LDSQIGSQPGFDVIQAEGVDALETGITVLGNQGSQLLAEVKSLPSLNPVGKHVSLAQTVFYIKQSGRLHEDSNTKNVRGFKQEG
jgi:hypothetical protein